MIITFETILIRLSVTCFDNVILKHRLEERGDAVGAPSPPPPPQDVKVHFFVDQRFAIGRLVFGALLKDYDDRHR